MKNLLLILALFVGNIYSLEMKPIRDLYNSLEKEASTYIYFANRCSGLYLNIARMINEQKDIKDKYTLDATNLITVSRIFLEKTTDLNVLQSQINTQKEIKTFEEKYSKASDEEFYSTGTRTTKMMADDLIMCQPMVKEFLEIIPDELLIKEIPKS